MGLDAVVVALFPRRPGALEVLLRHGVARSSPVRQAGEAIGLLFPELVAGILEPGDDVFPEGRDEADEEAGLRVRPASVEMLGPRSFPLGSAPRCFSSSAAKSLRTRWRSRPAATARRSRRSPAGVGVPGRSAGALRARRDPDMKTEIGLRRPARAQGALRRVTTFTSRSNVRWTGQRSAISSSRFFCASSSGLPGRSPLHPVDPAFLRLASRRSPARGSSRDGRS